MKPKYLTLVLAILAGWAALMFAANLYENLQVSGSKMQAPGVALEVTQVGGQADIMQRILDLRAEAVPGLPADAGFGCYVRFSLRGPDGQWLPLGFVGARLHPGTERPELVAWVLEGGTSQHVTLNTDGLTLWAPGENAWGQDPVLYLGNDGVLHAKGLVVGEGPYVQMMGRLPTAGMVADRRR